MDAGITDAVADGDLVLCERRGVAYQTERGRIAYDDSYLSKFEAYDDRIAKAINLGRCAMLMRHIQPDARVLDIGCGDGAFVREARAWGFDAHGYEVIPSVVAALRDDGIYASDPRGFDAVTMWDVIEHMDDHSMLLKIRIGAFLLASVPIFDDLYAIRQSKHYRPNEHLLYFTAAGFVAFIEAHGFRVIERSTHETDAGRDGIGAFAFRRTGETNA